jgi:hypothetical protein
MAFLEGTRTKILEYYLRLQAPMVVPGFKGAIKYESTQGIIS